MSVMASESQQALQSVKTSTYHHQHQQQHQQASFNSVSMSPAQQLEPLHSLNSIDQHSLTLDKTHSADTSSQQHTVDEMTDVPSLEAVDSLTSGLHSSLTDTQMTDVEHQPPPPQHTSTQQPSTTSSESQQYTDILAVDSRHLVGSRGLIAWMTPLQAKNESKKMKGWKWIPIEPVPSLQSSDTQLTIESKRIRKPKEQFEPQSLQSTPSAHKRHSLSKQSHQQQQHAATTTTTTTKTTHSQRSSIGGKAPAKAPRQSNTTSATSSRATTPQHRKSTTYSSQQHSPKSVCSTQRTSLSGQKVVAAAATSLANKAGATMSHRKSLNGCAVSGQKRKASTLSTSSHQFDFSSESEVKTKEAKIKELEDKLAQLQKQYQQALRAQHFITPAPPTARSAHTAAAAAQNRVKAAKATPASKRQKTAAATLTAPKTTKSTVKLVPPAIQTSPQPQTSVVSTSSYPSTPYLTANQPIPSGVVTKRGRQIKIPASNFLHEPVQLSQQMNKCLSLVNRFFHYKPQRGVFNEPVNYSDPSKPYYAVNYLQIIAPGQPIDLGTIRVRIQADEYKDQIQRVAEDIRMVFTNAIKFNPPEDWIHIQAKEMSVFFENDFAALQEKLSRPPPLRKSVSHAVTTPAQHATLDPGTEQYMAGLAERLENLESQLKNQQRNRQTQAHNDYEEEDVFESDDDSDELLYKKANRARSAPVARRQSSQPAQQLSPAAALNQRLTTPLSQKEKILLREDILAMPAENIGAIMEIVQRGMPQQFKQADDEEIELDIDKMSIATLRELQDYVKRVSLQAKKRKSQQFNQTATRRTPGQSPAQHTPIASPQPYSSTFQSPQPQQSTPDISASASASQSPQPTHPATQSNTPPATQAPPATAAEQLQRKYSSSEDSEDESMRQHTNQVQHFDDEGEVI